MKDLLADEFQTAVDEYLIRHRSILDIMSKLGEAQSRINRAIFKAVTSCGCIEIHASRPEYPEDITSIKELQSLIPEHVEGSLCENCREIVEAEIGNQLFYLAAMCNLLDLNMYDALIKEYKKVSTLGVFNLT